MDRPRRCGQQRCCPRWPSARPGHRYAYFGSVSSSPSCTCQLRMPHTWVWWWQYTSLAALDPQDTTRCTRCTSELPNLVCKSLTCTACTGQTARWCKCRAALHQLCSWSGKACTARTWSDWSSCRRRSVRRACLDLPHSSHQSQNRPCNDCRACTMMSDQKRWKSQR